MVMESAKNEGVSTGSSNLWPTLGLAHIVSSCRRHLYEATFSRHLSESTVLVDLPVLHLYSFVFGRPPSTPHPPQLGN